MRTMTVVLLLLLGALQYKLWFGSGGMLDVWQLRATVAALESSNQALMQENAVLLAEVEDLKHGLEAVEEQARSELGLIKPNETFYQILGALDNGEY